MISRRLINWKLIEHEIRVHGNKYASMDRVNKTISPERMIRLKNIFLNTSQSQLPLIAIGASEQLWTPSVMYNFGGASDTPFVNALNTKYASKTWKQEPGELIANMALKKKYDEDPNHLRVGSIIYEKNWGIAENDAFIIGAMDSGKEVHVATKAEKLSEINIEDLWGDQYGPSVLSHELLLLLASGYEIVPHSHQKKGLGMVLISDKPFEPKWIGESLHMREDISKGKVDDLIKLFEKLQSPKTIFSLPGSSFLPPGGGSSKPSNE